MTNPWDKYNQINNNVTQQTSNNPWDLYTLRGSDKVEEDSGALQESLNKIINRTRNIGKIIGSGLSISMGHGITPNQAELLKELSKGQEAATEGNVIAGHDIANMFDKVSVKDTIKSMWNTAKGGVGALINDPAESLNKSARTILELPGSIVESLVGDTLGAITGVNFDGSEIKSLTPEIHAAKTKAFIGNAVAAAVAPAVSKMVAAGFELQAAGKIGATGLSEASIQSATTPQLGALFNQKTLGTLGRAIVDDVAAGAASGIAQGAIANANDPNMISAMATGLLFAPIGVLTGWYRGVKSTGDLVESAMTRAKDVKLLRDWQNIDDANVNSARLKVENLLTSDDIGQALALDISKKKINYVDYKGDKPKIENPITKEVLEPTIDNLYNDFAKTLNDKDSFASSFVTYTQKKNLGQFSNELLEKFATKFVENNVDPAELSHLRSILKNNREAQNGKFTYDKEDLLQLSNKSGTFLTNNNGLLEIRDIESGEILSVAHTSREAKLLMQEMGEPANVTNMDAGSKVPSIGFEPPGVTPGSSGHIGDDWEPLITNATARVAGFDIRVGSVTAMNGFVEAIDRQFGTNLKHEVFEPLERSARLTKVAIDEDLNSGKIRLIDAFARSGRSESGIGFKGRFNTEQLEWVGKAMEAQSWDEMIAPNGYAKNFTISKESQALAKYMHENNIDASKVLYYRRAMAATKYQFMEETKQKAAKNLDFNETHGMPGEDAYAIYNEEKAAFEKLPGYIAAQQKVATFFNPDANFLKAAEMYDKVYNQPDGAAHAGAVSRLKLSLDHPDTYGLSRDDFAAKHLSSDQLRLRDMVEEAYNHFGVKFGIDDSRKLMRYMNHFRQHADILDSFVVGDFERGIQDGSMREFASAMIRTGEVSNYSTNPVSNLYSYIRAGNKSQIIYRELEERLNKLEAKIGPELEKINDPVLRQTTKERFNSYQRDIAGQTSFKDTEAMHAQAHVLKNMVVNEDNRRMTAEEIIREMNKPDHLDTIMNLSSAGLLGGRVSLAMRDNYDVWQKFFTKHGPKRLYNLVFKTKVSSKLIDTLVERGDITKPDALDIYNVTHTQGTSGGMSAAAKELAEFGFKTSLQGHYYMKNQAAVWLETLRNTNGILNKLSKGELTKQKAYGEIFLNSFDIPTQRKFDAYVSDGQFEAASRLLAGQEVRATVGAFSRGNQAPILNSKLGKLFGQLGSWSMTNRSVFENMMTRGTNKEIARSMARYVTTIAATQAAGMATGLNLGRWLLLPTSLVTTGGPVLQGIQAAGAVSAAVLGGNEDQIKYARRQAQRSFQQFIPGAYMLRDLDKAASLATDGSGYGAGRIAAQAVGIGVNEESRTFLDLVQGNYPIPPE